MVRRRAGGVFSWLHCRTLLLLFLVSFVWLQLHLAGLGLNSRGWRNGNDPPDGNDSAAILAMVPQVLHKYLMSRPRNLTAYTAYAGNDSHPGAAAGAGPPPAGGGPPPGALSGVGIIPDIETIKASIRRYNDEQKVLNEDIFGPLQPDAFVVVVQVHTRLIYLRHLIVSLAQAKDIDQVLLVFSHDFFDPEVNELVQAVDFCKVMQIFYPFSIQTHPNSFPGESPDDCPRDMKREEALIRRCTNMDHPDLYGHYREAKFTQTKHHWWWKANRVFDQLEVTRNHTGPVLFLEEDHFVAEDFIHVLRLMQKTCLTNCPHCNILSLGTYLKTYNYYGGDSKKAEVTPWISSKHNMGMAFNRSVWTDMRMCAKFFCAYDDYNWDWSLQHISQNCLPHRLHAMVMKGPRVFHIGECGVHHKKNNCESTAVISKVQKVILAASRHLYPSHLTLTVTSSLKKTKLRKGNGGWGDLRDHQLCLNISSTTR